MDLNSEILNKDKKQYNKKNLLNKNITKIVNLILSNQPIASNINNPNYNKLYKNNNLNKKVNSMKRNNLKNNKSLFLNDNKMFFIRDLSKINIQKKLTNNIYIKNKSNNIRFKKNNIFNKRKYNENLNNNIIRINNTLYHRQININGQIIDSVSNFKKTKSYSASQNLNNSNSSANLNNMPYRKINIEGEYGKIKNNKNISNLTVRKKNNNNKFYLIKKRKNLSHDLKAKINIYLEQQKKCSNRGHSNKINYSPFLINNNFIKKRNISYSSERIKKIKKLKNNKTSVNITSNNSDKDYTNISIKKNITTTNYSNNNIHYYTTNFNSSTNITETNNDLYNSKEKKISKKKIKLPFHPNYKNNKNEKKKFLIRNNKSEINIPYNKKNKICNSNINSTNNIKCNNLKYQKKEKINIQNSSKDKNNIFIDLFRKKFINSSSQGLHIKNKISISKNDLYISSKNKKKNIELNEGIEMNHFRIVTIIQENKKLLKENDNLIESF